MRRKIMLFIILAMCVIVGVGGVVALKNSNSVFKQNKKTIDLKKIDSRASIQNYFKTAKLILMDEKL